MVEIGLLSVFLGLLAFAAVSDLRAFVIPNWVSVLLIVAFLPWGGMQVQSGLVPGGVAAAIVLVGGFGLFAAGVWGAGDAKLLAAVAAWCGLAGLPRLLTVVALAGGVVAVGMLAYRTLRSGRLPRSFGGDVPYGLAIAVGGVDWWVRALMRIAG